MTQEQANTLYKEMFSFYYSLHKEDLAKILASQVVINEMSSKFPDQITT